MIAGSLPTFVPCETSLEPPASDLRSGLAGDRDQPFELFCTEEGMGDEDSGGEGEETPAPALLPIAFFLPVMPPASAGSMLAAEFPAAPAAAAAPPAAVSAETGGRPVSPARGETATPVPVPAGNDQLSVPPATVPAATGERPAASGKTSGARADSVFPAESVPAPASPTVASMVPASVSGSDAVPGPTMPEVASPSSPVVFSEGDIAWAAGTPAPASMSPAAPEAGTATMAGAAVETVIPPMSVSPSGTVRFGTFELRGLVVLPAAAEPAVPSPAGGPDFAGHALAAAPPLSPMPDRAVDIGERLKLLLHSRVERRPAGFLSGGTAEETRLPSHERGGVFRIPAGAEAGTLGMWADRAAAVPVPAEVAPPLAAALVRELIQSLSPRLAASEEAGSPAPGLRFSFASPVHGTVGIEVRGSGGNLTVTVQLQHELAATDAEACRRLLAEACQQRGYAGVQVELQYGGGREERGERRGSRRGHADDENVQLAGKDFPGWESPASPADSASSLSFAARLSRG